uniref:Uncharacterized protein n=1 Tax=Photinus pyralis TaxID=7054 RepID=A0A1Y1K414_PHOPY
MEDKVFLQAPPPPYSSGVSSPMAVGQGQQPQMAQIQNPPYPYHGQPQPNFGGPQPPLNTYNASPTPQDPYMSSPLIQQPPIAAINSTPRHYQPRPFGGIGFRNPKHNYIAIGIIVAVFLVLLIVFLTVFFTIFNKANEMIDGAIQKHDEFQRKHFSDNW